MKKVAILLCALMCLGGAAQGQNLLKSLGQRAKNAVAEKTFHYALVPTRHTRRYCYASLAWKHYKRIFTQKGGVFPVQ